MTDSSIRSHERQLKEDPNDPSAQEQLIAAKLRTVNVTRLLIEDAIRAKRTIMAFLDGVHSITRLTELSTQRVTTKEILAYLNGEMIEHTWAPRKSPWCDKGECADCGEVRDCTCECHTLLRARGD